MALFPPIILDKSKAIQVNSGNNYKIDFELQSEWMSNDELYGSDNPFTGWTKLTGINTSSVPNSGNLNIANFSAGTAGSWTHIYLKHVRGSEAAVSDSVIRYFVLPGNINIQCNGSISNTFYTLAADTDLIIKANATCTGDIVTHCVMTLEGYEPAKVYLDNGVFTHTFKLPFSNLVKDTLALKVKAITSNGYKWEKSITINKTILGELLISEDKNLINVTEAATTVPTKNLIGLIVNPSNGSTIKVTGKNLVPVPSKTGTWISNGLTYTVNEDYSITIKGTVNNPGAQNEGGSSSYYFIPRTWTFPNTFSNFTFSLEYTGSIQPVHEESYAGVFISYKSQAGAATQYLSILNAASPARMTPRTLKFDNNMQFDGFYFQARHTDIVDITIWPQVELGEKATKYEKSQKVISTNQQKQINLLDFSSSTLSIINSKDSGFSFQSLLEKNFFADKKVSFTNFANLDIAQPYSVFRQHLNNEIIREEKIINNKLVNEPFTDTTTQSGVPYIYRIVQGNKQILLGPIIEMAEDAWLKNTQGQTLRVRYNVDVGALKYNYSDAITPSINAPYPFVRRNAKQKYKTLTLGGLVSLGDLSLEDNTLLTDSDRNMLINARQQLDSYDYWIMAEKIYRERVLEFLYNPDIKLFMTAPEGNILVYISNVSLTPEKSLGRAIYNISCTLTEIAPIEVDTYVQYNQ